VTVALLTMAAGVGRPPSCWKSEHFQSSTERVSPYFASSAAPLSHPALQPLALDNSYDHSEWPKWLRACPTINLFWKYGVVSWQRTWLPVKHDE
jgi:hypothetical protein